MCKAEPGGVSAGVVAGRSQRTHSGVLADVGVAEVSTGGGSGVAGGDERCPATVTRMGARVSNKTRVAVVDLSNVCASPDLGGNWCSLARWQTLESAWRRQIDRDQEFVLICDRTLHGALRPSDHALFQRLKATGQLSVSTLDDADPDILEVAISRGGVVVSNDHFTDHRRIAGVEQVDRWGWKRRSGELRFENETLFRPLSHLISRRAQAQSLKKEGLEPGSAELKHRWECTTAGCPESELLVPRMRGGAATCPSCNAFLAAGEEWRDPVWVKVLFRGEELGRLLIEDGGVAELGRGNLIDAEDVGEIEGLADALARVSRGHVRLSNVEGSLAFEDLGSKNGLTLRSPAARERKLLGPAARTTRGTLVKGAVLLLGGTAVALELSGVGLPDE